MCAPLTAGGPVYKTVDELRCGERRPLVGRTRLCVPAVMRYAVCGGDEAE